MGQYQQRRRPSRGEDQAGPRPDAAPVSAASATFPYEYFTTFLRESAHSTECSPSSCSPGAARRGRNSEEAFSLSRRGKENMLVLPGSETTYKGISFFSSNPFTSLVASKTPEPRRTATTMPAHFISRASARALP